ncbi:hypothetical protein OUZ56_017501 [Daphnia magna]|uniref:Uncharacterized protein n=1 Tax=Daphnia magna TaxID=35525 RepID=A0ABR0AT24_9CRUS|nr:hypothetical protein OUZ56_017501 [Daphnia magna]
MHLRKKKKSLREDIGKLDLGIDVRDVDFALLMGVTHEEETHVHGLCTLVEYGVVNKDNYPLIVAP